MVYASLESSRVNRRHTFGNQKVYSFFFCCFFFSISSILPLVFLLPLTRTHTNLCLQPIPHLRQCPPHERSLITSLHLVPVVGSAERKRPKRMLDWREFIEHVPKRKHLQLISGQTDPPSAADKRSLFLCASPLCFSPALCTIHTSPPSSCPISLHHTIPLSHQPANGLRYLLQQHSSPSPITPLSPSCSLPSRQGKRIQVPAGNRHHIPTRLPLLLSPPPLQGARSRQQAQ